VCTCVCACACACARGSMCEHYLVGGSGWLGGWKASDIMILLTRVCACLNMLVAS